MHLKGGGISLFTPGALHVPEKNANLVYVSGSLMQEWPRLLQSKRPPFLCLCAKRGRGNLHAVQLCFERRRHLAIHNSRPARLGEKHQHGTCGGFVAAEMLRLLQSKIPPFLCLSAKRGGVNLHAVQLCFERRRYFAIRYSRPARTGEKHQHGTCGCFVAAEVATAFTEQIPAVSPYQLELGQGKSAGPLNVL